MNSFAFFLLFTVPSYDSAGQIVVLGVPAIPASHDHVIMILICTYNCLSSTPENHWEGQQTRLQISPTYASSIILSAFTLCWPLTLPCTPSLKCAMTPVHPHTTSLLCDVSVVQPHASFLIHLVSLIPLTSSLNHMVHLLHMPSLAVHSPPWLVPLILPQPMLRFSQTSVYPCTPLHIFPVFIVPLMLVYSLVILHSSPGPHAHKIAKNG